MTLLLLIILSLNGVKLGITHTAYNDAHINAFCSNESTTQILCEDTNDTIYGYRHVYSRAQFDNDQLTRIDYTFGNGINAAKDIEKKLVEQFGPEFANTDLLPDSYFVYFQRSQQQLELTFTAKHASINHPVIRLTLEVLKSDSE